MVNNKLIGFILLVTLLSNGCASVEKYNAQINRVRDVKGLKSDVHYIQQKLEKLHPDLYHYISKKDLEYKFDSLKLSLNTPMTSYDFYFKLSPVIASIKQGHTQIFPLTKKLRPSEKRMADTHGTSPLAQFDFELFDNKLYIVKNNSTDSTIKAGTELVSVNGEKPLTILNKFTNTFSSDGYNTTFLERRLATGFPRYFNYQFGILDSVNCQLNYRDTLRSVTLQRTERLKKIVVIKTIKEFLEIKRLQHIESAKRKLFGYDPIKESYSKQLIFPVKDSSIALLKISDFVKGSYKKFYKETFQQLNLARTKAIILDLRDNGGGRIAEINTLYSYLADSSFHLFDKSEVTSKTSLWHFGYYHNKPLWVQPIITVFLPIVALIDAYNFLKTTKDSDKYYYKLGFTKLKLPNTQRFKGKVYVLINGGCFSASCLLSANLKGSKRATFVGHI